MNRKTRTLSCRSPVRTRPPLLPGSRAPDAAGGSHGADGPTQPAPPPEAHHHGGQHHVRLGAPNSRSVAALARTRVAAPPAFGLIAPARPSGAEIPARMAGDSSASQHLLLKWKGVHETGSTPTSTSFWADGIHVQARLEDDAQCLLVIIGATPEGNKELVGLTDGVRENAQSWKGLLLDLKRHRLVIGPQLAIAEPALAKSRGALGFWHAIEDGAPKTRGQPCWGPKPAKVLNRCRER